jgi:hypothetical protein
LSERELVEAWRQRGRELVEQATALEMDEGHTQEVENLLDAAEDYFIDANTLEGGIEIEDR